MRSCPKGSKDDLHIWLRLLFSCLVDADFLDTERYMKPSTSLQRSVYPSVTDLLDRFPCPNPITSFARRCSIRVILDEAQLLPTESLEPCLAAIRTLTTHYGVSFVLCTPTQPPRRFADCKVTTPVAGKLSDYPGVELQILC